MLVGSRPLAAQSTTKHGSPTVQASGGSGSAASIASVLSEPFLAPPQAPERPAVKLAISETNNNGRDAMETNGSSLRQLHIELDLAARGPDELLDVRTVIFQAEL